MSWFDNNSSHAQAHEFVSNTDQFQEHHKAKVSHELIGGAAAFAAMKAYQDHCAKNGRPVDHAKAKEFAAGLAGAFVDRIAETKGADFWDREKAKHHANKEVTQAVDSYGY